MDAWTWLLAAFLVVTFGFHADAEENSELEALLSFRKSVDDPLVSLNNSKRGTDVCHWIGISCSSEGQIAGIQLDSLSLLGVLPFSTVQALPHLRNLSASGNNFTAMNISSQKCSLEVLDLSRNHFSTENFLNTVLTACDSIRLLNLSHNKLHEISVKKSIGNTMVSLDLSYNSISGSLPASFFTTCKNLQFFYISTNQLVGRVPQDIIKHCKSLRELSLDSNYLTGKCCGTSSSNNLQKLNVSTNFLTTFQINNYTSLQELDISCNNISGTVLWNDCPALKVLNLSDNYFSEPFLSVFVNRSLATVFKSLEVLKADHNKFTGELPTVPSSLKVLDLSCNLFNTSNTSICPAKSSLKSLVLVYNKLHGPVLNSVMQCGNLEMLDLSINSLTGLLPGNMCSKLPKLQHLVLWGNQLEGSIPATIGNCSELVVLDLSQNNLTGVIPEEISQLKKMLMLYLQNNMLSGPIPASVGSLLNLRFLVVCHNKLQGGLPSELRNSKSLHKLLANDNQLTGQIPSWIGRSSKVERGISFPFLLVFAINTQPFICKGYQELFIVQGIRFYEFKQLPIANRCQAWFFLAPPSFNSSIYDDAVSPEVLDLSYNSFTGTIPEEYGGMQDLYVLKLEHNLFTGPIPSTIGKLQKLERLDLSYNQLNSYIPSSLGNLTFLKQFNLSHNRLIGRIPQSAQLVTFPASSYEGNPGLCGIPLAECANLHNPATSVGIKPAHKDDDGDYKYEWLAGIVSGAVSCLLWTFATFFSKSLEGTLKRGCSNLGF